MLYLGRTFGSWQRWQFGNRFFKRLYSLADIQIEGEGQAIVALNNPIGDSDVGDFAISNLYRICLLKFSVEPVNDFSSGSFLRHDEVLQNVSTEITLVRVTGR